MTMPADELNLYRDYYQIQPWGGEADDLRSALVAYVVSASAGGKDKMDKFRLRWWQPESSGSDFDHFLNDMTTFANHQWASNISQDTPETTGL